MTQYVGLDVSLKQTKLHVLDEAGNQWPLRDRGCCDRCSTASIRSDCGAYWSRDGTIDHLALAGLTAEGLPMICLDARHAKKALDMKVNKTDANDAEGLAHLVRAGWYREVRVKSEQAMLA